MVTQSSTVDCPGCGQPASLSLVQHTDEQGHPWRQELSFACRCRHQPCPNDLLVMWARAHAAAAV